MHRPAFRSVLTAAASVPSRPAALFSTSSAQSVLKWVPNSKERQAAAASELSSLDSNNDAGSPSTPVPAKTAAPSVSPFSKEAPANAIGSSSSSGSNQIINVRSLPRTPGGGGGGPRFPGTGVSSATGGGFGSGRFRASVEGGGGGRTGGGGGFGLRGPRAGGAAGRGRNARPRGRNNNNRNRDNKKKQEAKRAEGLTEEQEQQLYVEAREWLHFHEFGRPEAFEPALTREGLLGFNPAVPSSAAAPAGHLSTALQSMRLLAGGMPFTGTFEPGESNTAASPDPEGVRNQVHKNETVFFDSLVERVRTEQALRSKRALAKLKAADLPADTSLIKAPSAATKASILEAAVRGVYSGPSISMTATATGSPLLDTTHRYQAKDNTYSPAKARQFEAKLLELLPKEASKASAARA